MSDTSTEELYLLGKMLSNNQEIEGVAKEVSTEEFSPALREIYDAICQLWVKEPRRQITAQTVHYYCLTLHPGVEDRHLATAWASKCDQGIKVAENGAHLTVEAACSRIHRARTEEIVQSLYDKLQKHRDNPLNEVALAIASEIVDKVDKGLRLPKFEALAKTMTEPPTYIMTVNLHGKTKEFQLSSAQLNDPKAVERRILEHFDQYPDYLPGRGLWKLIISRLMRKIRLIAVDKDRPELMIPLDRVELNEVVQEYLDHAGRAKQIADMQPHQIYENEEDGTLGIVFRDVQIYCRSKGLSPSNGKLAEALINIDFKRTSLNKLRNIWIKKQDLL